MMVELELSNDQVDKIIIEELTGLRECLEADKGSHKDDKKWRKEMLGAIDTILSDGYGA